MYKLEATIDFYHSTLCSINPIMNKLVIQKIKDSFYADDFSSGSENLKLGQMLYNDTKRVFIDAEMNSRKLNSNSKILVEYIKNFERKDGENNNVQISYADKVINNVKQSNFKVLRIPWDKKDNQFMFSLHHLTAKTDSEKK